MQRLNIITGHQASRTEPLMNEIKRQGITNYKLWPSVYLKSIKASINRAHRQIVEFARLAEFAEVIIAEDDFEGTHPDSFKHFLSQKPDDFDIYMSMVYLGDLDENNKVQSFTGMTLYCVASKFYDKFLSVDPEQHIDHALSNIGGDFYVCNPFTFIQRPGISANTGKYEVYDSLLANRKLFGG